MHVDHSHDLERAEHLVQFYEDDELLSSAVTKFLYDGLVAGDALLVIASPAHADAFRRSLAALADDVTEAIAAGRLTVLDVEATLAAFMRNGEPDAELFEATVGASIAARLAALPEAGRLRVYGEMVDQLWKSEKRVAALRLEELWNELQARHAFTLFCAYAMAGFYKEPGELQRIGATHSRVLGASRPPAEEQLAHEIGQREEVEAALRESLRQQRGKEEALRQSEEQLRDFVDNAPVGMHRVAADGTILWCNRAELVVLGYAEPEYVGHPITEFHADASTGRDLLARLNRGESLRNFEARLRAKDGTIRQVLINATVVVAGGKLQHARCFLNDITEQRKAEEGLRQRERQLQLVTDALPVLVSFIDPDMRYRFVSAAYERWFGQLRSSLIGRHVKDVIGAEAFEVIRGPAERALAGNSVTFEAELSFQGRPRFVEATHVPQWAADGKISGFVELVADVTDRRAFERFRFAAARRSERLLRITAAIASAVTSAQVYEALVDQVAEAVEASSAALWIVDQTSRTGRLARAVGFEAQAQADLAVLPLDTGDLLPAVEAMREGKPIFVDSHADLAERYPKARALTIAGTPQRISCLPLVAHGRCLGVLGIAVDEARPTSDEERDFLLLIARYASQAVERLLLFEAEQANRASADAAAERLSVLARATRAFDEAGLGFEPRVQTIVAEMQKALDGCVIIALRGTDGTLQVASARHPDPGVDAQLQQLLAFNETRLDEGVTGAIARTGESVLLPQIDPSTLVERVNPAFRALLEKHPIYAFVGAALKVQGRLIGTVTATRVRPGEIFGAEDLRLLEELAGRAAIAIESSRLFEEIVGARARAEQLYRFARAVVSAEDLDAVYAAALSAIEAGLGTRRASILTYGDDPRMRFRAWRGLSDTYRQAVEGHSPWSSDAIDPDPLLIPAAALDPALADYAPLFQQEGIGALAFFPLVSSGKLLGKFMVYYDEPHRFRTHEVEMARAIADHLAQVIARFTVMTRLEETVRQNELLAGVLAHDLRNPLGAMMTGAQLLLLNREADGDPRDVKPLSRILSSGERMSTMISQLLDFTRARSGGGITIEPHATNLADLCRQAVAELEIAHPEWKLVLNLFGDAEGRWDADRLLQVISNLLGNAGQHGAARGRITVTVDGRDAQQVVLRIHNEGVISPALVPHLFEAFRGTRYRRDRSRGLGLGLFIVREIARAHDGSVEVTSTEAEGTSIVVRLPRVVPDTPAEPSPDEVQS